jgi:hypothetical protein
MFDYEVSYYSIRDSSRPMSWSYAIHCFQAKDDDEAEKLAKEFVDDPKTGPKSGPIHLKKMIKVLAL